MHKKQNTFIFIQSSNSFYFCILLFQNSSEMFIYSTLFFTKKKKTIYSKLIYKILSSQVCSTEQEAHIQAFIQPIFSGCFCFSRGPLQIAIIACINNDNSHCHYYCYSFNTYAVCQHLLWILQDKIQVFSSCFINLRFSGATDLHQLRI